MDVDGSGAQEGGRGGAGVEGQGQGEGEVAVLPWFDAEGHVNEAFLEVGVWHTLGCVHHWRGCMHVSTLREAWLNCAVLPAPLPRKRSRARGPHVRTRVRTCAQIYPRTHTRTTHARAQALVRRVLSTADSLPGAPEDALVERALDAIAPSSARMLLRRMVRARARAHVCVCVSVA